MKYYKKNTYVPYPISLDDNDNIPILIQEVIESDDPAHNGYIEPFDPPINNDDAYSGNGLINEPNRNITEIPDGKQDPNNPNDPDNPENKITDTTNSTTTARSNIYGPMTDPGHFFDPTNLVPVQIGSMLTSKLLKNLCVPSTSHAYSVAVEYFKRWLLDKFDNGYFKTIYIEGKHLFSEISRINEPELIKKGKPAIAIIPQLDINFNREGIDNTLNDLNYYARTFNHRETFFKDHQNEKYIGCSLEQLLFNFNVKIKVNSRSKQLDLVKYIKMALKVGATSGYYMDIDMHVPYDMLYTMAEELGFKVDPEHIKILEPIKFLSYLNRHSEIPFVYKLRSINGKDEFFIRVSNMYTHIRVQDLSIDDGEKQGMVSSNYFIEFNAEVRFPAPKIYCYFSMNKVDFMRFSEKNGNIISYIVNFSNVPNVNDNGWDMFISTAYEEEDKSKPLTIEFGEIFKGDINIMRLIDYCKDNYMSPSAFLDFKVFNNNKEYQYDIDWDTLTLTTKEKVKHILSDFVVYADKGFINDTLMLLDKGYHKRIKETTITDNNSNISPFK